MTIKDLARLVLTSEESTEDKDNDSPAMKELLKRLETKRFWWISNASEHARRFKVMNGNCCFNHIIGLPKKNGEEKEFFDYQRNIYKALFTPSVYNSRAATPEEESKYKRLLMETELKSKTKSENIKQTHADVLNQKTAELVYPFKVKHVWIKKAAGLGITELILRIMVWLCVRNDEYKNTHMCLVTGPRLGIAIELINRIRKLFEPHGVMLGGSMTSIKINNVTITAYPSNHLDSMRGLDKVSFIFLDEADFFPKHEQENARTISERYIGKSSPFIVICSTANRPDGLFASIERESLEICIYKKIFLHYTEGLGKIYTKEDIENAKRSPSFPREYELQYLGLIGNVFAPAAIDKVQQIEYDPDQIIPDCKVSIGVDPSFGSSKFGIVATRFVNERIEVFEAEEYERPDF